MKPKRPLQWNTAQFVSSQPVLGDAKRVKGGHVSLSKDGEDGSDEEIQDDEEIKCYFEISNEDADDILDSRAFLE